MNEFVKSLSQEEQDELNILNNKEILPLTPIKNGLSDDQNNGMEAIINWLYTYKGSRNENNFFALRGSAGTGKTTLLGQLLKQVDNTKYRSSRICICAPTHKAKKVISVKTGWRNSETLQALLGLKLDTNLDDFDPNNPTFNQIGDRKMKDYDLLLIDESSMINSELYKTIVECSNQSGCMVLFIGDTLQLNPVKEYHISPALTAPIHSYTLTQIMRQENGNPLIPLLDILRDDIINNTQNYLDILKGMPRNINPAGQGYIATTDSIFFGEQMNGIFLGDGFRDDKNFCRYICWMNDTITLTNQWLRNKVFRHTVTAEVGEILLSYKTVSRGDDVLVVNSDDYVIEEIENTIVSDYEYPLQVLRIRLKGIDTGTESIILLLEANKENYENYTRVYESELLTAKAKGGRAWKKFYDFKSTVLISNKTSFTNQLTKKVEIITKDIDFGYGITAHKSQGSTYNTVFVNYKDICKIVEYEKNDKMGAEIMKKRLLYVALSRASDKVYIIM